MNKIVMTLLCVLPMLVVSQNAKKSINLVADESEYDVSEGRSVFKGNVDITQGFANIKADRVELSLNEAGEVSLFVGIGKPAVFVYKGKKQPITAKANKMTYDVISETITLTDKASVLQGENTLTGSAIVYNLKTEIIDVKKIKVQFKPATKKK